MGNKKRSKRSDRTLCFDFDGVIASFDGWKGVDVLGNPNYTVIETIQRLHKSGWHIVIFTTRKETPILRAWLHDYEVPYDSINSNRHNPPDTSIKPIYHCIIDDRAVRYNGQNGEELYLDIMDVIDGMKEMRGKKLVVSKEEKLRRIKMRLFKYYGDMDVGSLGKDDVEIYNRLSHTLPQGGVEKRNEKKERRAI